jgi:hypothetical protein
MSKGAESWLYGGWSGVRKWLREQDVTFYCQGLEILVVCYDKCLNKFGNCVEKKGDWCPKIPVLFLSPLTSVHVTKKAALLTDFLRNCKQHNNKDYLYFGWLCY